MHEQHCVPNKSTFWDQSDRLVAALWPISYGRTREEVLDEWFWCATEYKRAGGHCICGASIHYFFYVMSKISQRVVAIGSTCIERVDRDLNCDVRKHVEEALRESGNQIHDEIFWPHIDVLYIAYKRKWISDWEWGFMYDIRRKRRLSEKQVRCALGIIKRVMHRVQIKPHEGEPVSTGKPEFSMNDWVSPARAVAPALPLDAWTSPGSAANPLPLDAWYSPEPKQPLELDLSYMWGGKK